MLSYQFKRRSFMQGVGGALGLKVLLRNLEAGAQGATSPPRLLVTHWPVGKGVNAQFIPTTGNTGSPILKPFGDKGLSGDMTVFNGFHIQYNQPTASFGGGHESGTVKMMTGVATPGTRAGEPETDDAFAGGPSFDQIFLKNAPVLQRPGQGYANSICDSRVDFLEISTQCLSYGYATQPVAVALGSGMENTPLLPTLSPVQQWMNIFGSIVPGGAGGVGGASGVNNMMLKALMERKSVLDYAINELAQLKTLAPSTEASKIQIHADAIRAIETQLATNIQNAQGTGAGGAAGSIGCAKPPQPAAIVGKADDRKSHNDYGNPATTVADDVTHAMVGALHWGVLQAAMVCDLIRVATFQWSPGTNHVAFQGQMPGETNTIYMHHPESHKIGSADTTANPLGSGPGGAMGGTIAQFLANVQTWYNGQMAGLLAGMKTTLDGFGNNLFDNTIIPYVTCVQDTGHGWNNMAAMMFGGKALGFQQGTYKALNNVPLNNLWMTIAQAFGLSASTAPLNAEQFARAGTYAPIAGLWVKPV